MKLTPIELTCELNCELVESWGNDWRVVDAARVSTQTERQEGDEKLISFLMRNRHASPFEHMGATFILECPIFVVREWHRHRTQSYNEMSGRYSVLQPKFYAPDYDRPLIQKGKPGAYKFELPEDDIVNINLYKEMRFAYQATWNSYEYLIDQGIAKEVARMVLPVGIYTKFYASANLRNWLGFLSLRTAPDAMHEIRMLAGKVETALHKIFPLTLEYWDEFGRHSV